MKKVKSLIIFTAIFSMYLPGQNIESSEEYDELSVVHQQNWVHFAQEPLVDLKTARAAFEHEDYETAAYSLRQVNAYLMLEALRLDNGQELLNPIIANINGLVKKLENTESVSQKEYNAILGEVNLTLSTHYHDLAKKSWNNDKPVKAGYALQASTLYLERAEKISSSSFSDENKSIIDDSKGLSEDLINGNVEPQDESVKAKIKVFGGALKEFKNKSSEEFRMEKRF